jgi:hypothetical protein
MSTKLFRACGVAAALLIPAGGLTVLASGSVGASGEALTATIGGGGQQVTCPTYAGGGAYHGCTATGSLPATVTAARTGTTILATSLINVRTTPIATHTCTVVIFKTIALTGNVGHITLTKTPHPNYTATSGCGTLNGATVTLTVNTPS